MIASGESATREVVASANDSEAVARSRRQSIVRLHWRVVVSEAVVFWAVTRVIYAVFTWFDAVYATAGTGAMEVAHPLYGPSDLLAHWNRFDALYFYLPIALSGYSTNPSQGTAVFFPLYPLLVRGLWLLSGQHLPLLVCGVVVGNVGTLLAYVALALLAAAETGERASVRSLLRTVTAYPLAFFLVAPYPMGWLLAGVAGALLCARCHWWWAAGACAAGATLTHPLGAVVVVALMVEVVSSLSFAATPQRVLRRLRQRAMPVLTHLCTRVDAVCAVLAVPLALAAYALYCRDHDGDVLAFVHQEMGRAGWGYERLWPWQGLGLVLHNIVSAGPIGSFQQARVLTDTAPLLAVVVLTSVAVWRRALPLSFLMFCASLCLLWLSLLTVTPDDPIVTIADGRLVLVAVPIFLLLAHWSVRRGWLSSSLVFGGALFQAVLLAFYLRGGWLV